MTNLYPKLNDCKDDEIYYDKLIEVLLIRLELNVN